MSGPDQFAERPNAISLHYLWQPPLGGQNEDGEPQCLGRAAARDEPRGPDDRPQPETSTALSTAKDRTRIPWEKWGLHEKGPVPPPPEEEPDDPDDDADIRKRARAFRRLGMPRHEALDTILRAGRGGRRPGALTNIEVKRIFDEEWPEP